MAFLSLRKSPPLKRILDVFKVPELSWHMIFEIKYCEPAWTKFFYACATLTKKCEMWWLFENLNCTWDSAIVLYWGFQVDKNKDGQRCYWVKGPEGLLVSIVYLYFRPLVLVFVRTYVHVRSTCSYNVASSATPKGLVRSLVVGNIYITTFGGEFSWYKILL